MCFILLLTMLVCMATGYLLGGAGAAAIGGLLSILLWTAIVRSHNFYRIRMGLKLGQWLRVRFGRGMDVGELARRLGLVPSELKQFVPRYTEVFITKRSGGRRRLLVPDESTRVLQRCILRKLLGKLRVHPAAYGFVKGRSAIQNAARHSGQAVVITLDIIDFFSSTKSDRVRDFFLRIGWSAKAAALLTRLTTHEGGLPQGAPTSPALSNLLNFYTDVQIQKIVEEKQGTYTRYADDLAISYPLDYPGTIHSVVDRVKRILKAKGYRMHSLGKLKIRRQHQRQVVTGLVVNVKPQLSRKDRRKLRAIRHRKETGGSATLTEAQWQGWKSYQMAIDRVNETSQIPVFRVAENRKIVRRRKTRRKKGREKIKRSA